MKALSNCPPCRVQSSNRFLLRELANGVLGLQEPWLLHDFAEDFYGVELRLVVVGYIRPEANFVSLEALVERIHKDGRIAKAALDMTPYSQYAEDPYLTTLLPNSAT
jgi:hypothetical protein